MTYCLHPNLVKYIYIAILLAEVTAMCVALFTACGSGLSGKYESEFLGITLEFKSGNRVVCIDGDDAEDRCEGTYTVKEDSITFDFGEDSGVSYLNDEMSFEKGSGYIKIDDVTFTKK